MSNRQSSAQASDRIPRNIHRVGDEVKQAGEMTVEFEQFFEMFLSRIIEAMAARGGSVWLADQQQLIAQYESKSGGSDVSNWSISKLTQLHLDEVIRNKKTQLLPVRFESRHDAANRSKPDGFVRILVPLLIEGAVEGVIEIRQRSGIASDAQEGQLRFLEDMAEIAVDWMSRSKTMNHSMHQNNTQEKVEGDSKAQTYPTVSEDFATLLENAQCLNCCTVLPVRSVQLSNGWLSSNEVASGRILRQQEGTLNFDMRVVSPQSLLIALKDSLREPPISLLVGPDLHFWFGDSATKELSIHSRRQNLELGEPIAQSSQEIDSIHSNDRSCRNTDTNESETVGSESLDVRWSYDTMSSNDCLAVELFHIPNHIRTPFVIVEITSLDDPEAKRTHLLPLQRDAFSRDRGTAELLDSGINELGPHVSVSVGPPRPDNPHHVQTILSHLDYVVLPIHAIDATRFETNVANEIEKRALESEGFGWALQVAHDEGGDHV